MRRFDIYIRLDRVLGATWLVVVFLTLVYYWRKNG